MHADSSSARLYRAIEATAQVALKDGHEIESTEKVALDRIPASLRPQWQARAKEGLLTLGLQDAYALLTALSNPVGQRFRAANLDGTKSPLMARNRSILAHGFDRISDNVFDKLWSAALALADIKESDLPSFATLGDRPKGEH